MSIAAEAPAVVPIVSHRPWWRGRIVWTAVIVAVMFVAHRAFGGDYPWPSSLAWNSLSAHLDGFQTWIIDQRTAEHKNIVFAVFDAFRAFGDNLVDWLSRLLLWMTWVGTTVV